MRTETVTGCEDCLFHRVENRTLGDWCIAPDAAKRAEVEAYIWNDEILPPSCPLLKGPVTVMLEGVDKNAS